MGDVNQKDERLGQINKNTYGSSMEVVKYNRAVDMWVEFESGEIVHTSWKAFCLGEVKSRYDKRVYGIGYIGEGEYTPHINGKRTRQYQIWLKVLERCYASYVERKYPSYKQCEVDERWHNFQNFAKWYDDNYYVVEGEKMEIDKDILVKGNKIYSPETCVFVPKRINLLFVKNDVNGRKLPIGVCFYKRDKKYQVNCKDDKSNDIYLGRYDTIEEAFDVYKTFKESVIKKVANQYKDKIPERLYIAMVNYQVEITD